MRINWVMEDEAVAINSLYLFLGFISDSLFYLYSMRSLLTFLQTFQFSRLFWYNGRLGYQPYLLYLYYASVLEKARECRGYSRGAQADTLTSSGPLVLFSLTDELYPPIGCSALFLLIEATTATAFKMVHRHHILQHGY